jgi:hypothetical protein
MCDDVRGPLDCGVLLFGVELAGLDEFGVLEGCELLFGPELWGALE